MLKPIKAAGLSLADIVKRTAVDTSAVDAAVADIIADVIRDGDAALYAFAEKFDCVKLTSLSVTEAELKAAYGAADKYFIDTLKQAKENITEFHRRQLAGGFYFFNGEAELTQRVLPLAAVGIYVPGGTAAYPSTVLMNALPAIIAGVERVVMVTPPDKAGNVNQNILAAAYVAGVKEIYKVGGAQAVAALAYGTESVPKVDKIVGPGNVYVATAKKQLFGRVGIDMVAGPSEIMIIADDSAKAEFVAADMLSQAEHDKNATAVLVTTSERLAQTVAEQVEEQLKGLSRRAIAEASIENNGRILLTDTLDEAVALANAIAPEHLEICTANANDLVNGVVNAGSVFLGNYTPEPIGDYFAGTNHTLPTGGTARFSSPLSVDDFVKKMQIIRYTEDALKEVGDRVIDFSEREGLQAHGLAVKRRMEKKDE